MKKRTKIVATIGPASDSQEVLEKMVAAGLDVARINFSHGTHASNGESIKKIKALRKEKEIPLGIMADLQGPRIRVRVPADLAISQGEKIFIVAEEADKNLTDKVKKIELDVKGIIADIEVGSEILIEDGSIRLKIVSKDSKFLEAEVISEGVVKNHKGVNIPDAKLKIPILTAKDEADLEFVLGQEVDFVALSFVANSQEINSVREKIKKILKRDKDLPQIVSKIERKEALRNIEEIIQASDVVMVARGDLGIETAESEVAIHQKEIIAKCLKQAKPVIVATQMLNSMIENPSPTRAEVADVCNAVIDHADAVMLSGESANGKYPVEAVAMMSEIILKTEKSSFDDTLRDCPKQYESFLPVLKIFQNSSLSSVEFFSSDGLLARLIANCRKEQTLIAVTDNLKVYYQLSIIWGVNPYYALEGNSPENLLKSLEKARLEGKINQEEEVLKLI